MEKGYLDSTVINNVETLCSVVKIVLNGSDWYRAWHCPVSRNSDKHIRLFLGIYEVEALTSMISEMVEPDGRLYRSEVLSYCIGPDDFDERWLRDLTGGSNNFQQQESSKM